MFGAVNVLLETFKETFVFAERVTVLSKSRVEAPFCHPHYLKGWGPPFLTVEVCALFFGDVFSGRDVSFQVLRRLLSLCLE